MPELPEVEVLVRHLAPLVRDRRIRGVEVRRASVVAPTSIAALKRALTGARFTNLVRRGKYLVFSLCSRAGPAEVEITLLGHLGMTGRMFIAQRRAPLPKHAAVVLDLGPQRLVFEDTRYFGRFTLDTAALTRLGPEPLGREFTLAAFSRALRRSAQAIKVKLLDQSLVAGIGNIYASEALFRARLSPRRAARRLRPAEVRRLRAAIRAVLREAVAWGSTVPLNLHGPASGDGLFYFGRDPATPDYYHERLRVYDRAGQPCAKCGAAIRRLTQAARSTYYCPRCQR